MSSRSLIVLDNRERSLATALGALLTRDTGSIDMEVAVLSVGDVEIRQQQQQQSEGSEIPRDLLFVFERKTWSDLASSICDGRWAEQKARMTETIGAGRIAYIVEGGDLAWGVVGGGGSPVASSYAFIDDREGIDGIEDIDGGCGETLTATHSPSSGATTMLPRVRGALLSMLIGVSNRVPVIRTRDVSDTAAFLVKAAEFLTSVDRGGGGGGGYAAAACRASTAVFPKKRDNVDVRQCFLQQLCQVPGVSFVLASSISDVMGVVSMRGLVNAMDGFQDNKARLEALQRVPKVGRKTAERILAFAGFA